MKVTIKKIIRDSSWGIRDPRTNKIKGKYEQCFDKWVPGISKRTKGLLTGLTPKESAAYEKDLNLEPGDLSPNGKFWDDFVIIIPEEGLEIDTDAGTLEMIKYKALSVDPTVVESIEKSKTISNAEYLMINEKDIAKEKNNKRDVVVKAYARFATMTQTEIRDALYMLGKPGDRHNEDTDPEVCQDRLGEIIEENPKKFIDVVGDESFKDKVWIKKLIKAGVITKHGVGKGDNQPLYFQDIFLGNGLDEAVVFINAKDNQKIYIGLKKALEA